MRLRTRNHRYGTKKARPIARPSSRWKYSHQKIPLNSASVMPRLTCRYSGVAWYFSNAACHCVSSRGGSVPTIGCHSVIDRPECVRRVTPPTTTIANTSAQQTKSHAWIDAALVVRSVSREVAVAAVRRVASAAIDRALVPMRRVGDRHHRLDVDGDLDLAGARERQRERNPVAR